MNVLLLSAFFLFLLVFEFIYFKIADKYNIIDKPNHRSSHTQITIRGGGIIFSLSIFICTGFYGFQYPYFLLGLFLISLISFIDDINPIANKTRIIFHLIAVSLLFYQLRIYGLPYYLIAASFVFVIGTINAVNFMDGINGITGLYGLIVLLTLYYINRYIIVFTADIYLMLCILSLGVFNFFNFRKHAKCFAGDVGSVGLAFIIVFFLLQLIIATNNFKYIFILLIYGLDVVTTIFFRIYRGENVFEAHRTHFYQYLTNEKSMPHLLVALLYGFLQLLINYLVIIFLQSGVMSLIVSIFITTIAFILARLYFEGYRRLFTKSL